MRVVVTSQCERVEERQERLLNESRIGGRPGASHIPNLPGHPKSCHPSPLSFSHLTRLAYAFHTFVKSAAITMLAPESTVKEL